MLGGARFMGASAARLLAVKFLAAWNPAADVLALASLEVDVSKLEAGNCMIVKWRGKPVFIRARTDDEIEAATSVSMGELRDPQPDEERVQKPEMLVCIGVCTHLGCVPINGAGDFGGWFCPCHGSHYDTSGRIRKGPAPLNLEIPRTHSSTTPRSSWARADNPSPRVPRPPTTYAPLLARACLGFFLSGARAPA